MKKFIRFIFILFLVLIPGRVPAADVVGALMPTKNVPYFMAVHEALVSELELLGAGASIILQKPAPNEIAWKNATRKFVILDARVIVAYGSETALAIVRENSDVPVVYAAAYAPEKCGIGDKATGMSSTVPIDGLLDNLKKISNFTKLGILYDSHEIGSVIQMETAEDLSSKIGAKVIKIDTHDSDAIDLAGADAVLLTSSATINQEKNLERIVQKARSKKIATASVLCSTCPNGVLLSVSADPVHQGKGAARMVAAILNGTKMKDIPPNNQPKVEMTVNLKQAKDLGFSIPFELLGTAKVVK